MNPERQMPRRRVIEAGLAAVALVALGEKVQRRYFPTAPEAEVLSPYGYLNSVVAIYEGANLRTSPRIPDRTRFSSPENTIEWSDIAQVNGVDLTTSAFLVDSPHVAKGQRTSKRDRVHEEYFPTLAVGNDWIELGVRRRSTEEHKLAYVNIENSGENVVSLTQAYIVKVKHSEFPDIGKVYVPSTPETMVREIYPNIKRDLWLYWLDQKKRGYGTAIPLAKVVLEEPQVRVRNAPALEYMNGEPVEIIGNVKTGTLISDVKRFYDDGWSLFRRKSIRGDLYDEKGRTVESDPEQPVWIFTPFLQRVPLV